MMMSHGGTCPFNRRLRGALLPLQRLAARALSAPPGGARRAAVRDDAPRVLLHSCSAGQGVSSKSTTAVVFIVKEGLGACWQPHGWRVFRDQGQRERYSPGRPGNLTVFF